jgi:hypothetical protein
MRIKLNDNIEHVEPRCDDSRTNARSSVREGESQPWWNTFLDARIVISALVLGLLIGVCGVGIDRLVHHASRIYASDLYTCVVASIFSYLLMIYEKRRRTILARRMAIAAEVNHHIRNALTAIVYSTSVRRDQPLQSVLKDATDRIDWVLTTVLPDGEESLKWPVQAPQWRPGEWRGTDPVHDSVGARKDGSL